MYATERDSAHVLADVPARRDIGEADQILAFSKTNITVESPLH